MTWRMYRWDDASAPVLTGQAGIYALINVLDACLVNGYGSKPAAGWTKSFSGTGKAAYRQGAGSNLAYLRVDCSTSSQLVRLRGFSTMTDVDTGTNPFPTDAQASGGGMTWTSDTTDATQRPWIVFADEKRFYIWIGHNITTSTNFSADATFKVCVFFGDIISRKPADAFSTMIICGASTGTNAAGASRIAHTGGSGYTDLAGHFISGSANQVSGSVGCSKFFATHLHNAGVSIGSTSSNNFTYPDPINTGMTVCRIAVYSGSVNNLRGYLPGFYAPLHSLPGAQGDTISGSVSGGLNGKNFILLNISNSTTVGRALFETSDTVEV